MKAWVLNSYGSIENPEFKTVETPRLEAGHVLVEVHSAALNFADAVMIRGTYQVKPALPAVMGAEFAGVVAAAHPDSRFRAGDRVAGQVWSGAYGEYCLVDERRLLRLPKNVSFHAAAALPVSYTTAQFGLTQPTEVAAGQTVLVHAAAGGIGIAATQLAKARGAKVLATAGSEEKLRIAEANGADVVINYREAGWVDKVKAHCPGGVDFVIDPVGGEFTTESLRCLSWRGHLRIVGFASGKPAAIPANRLLVKAQSVTGVYWSHELDAGLVECVQTDLVDLLANERIRPLIGGVYDLADYRNALADLEKGKTIGKIILDIKSSGQHGEGIGSSEADLLI